MDKNKYEIKIRNKILCKWIKKINEWERRIMIKRTRKTRKKNIYIIMIEKGNEWSPEKREKKRGSRIRNKNEVCTEP